MGKKQNLEAYWEALLKSKVHQRGLLLAYEGETLAALNLAASIVANADMVEDPVIANEFALLSWENEVARDVHPPLRKLRECRELRDFPACRPCTAWELDGESACMSLM